MSSNVSTENVINDTADFVLASASPRRSELLRQIGCRFRVSPAAIDEAVLPKEPAEVYVKRMALEKARAGWWHQDDQDKKLPVLGADTAVVLGGEIFGKPVDQEHGIAMLLQLSGTEHQVLSAVAMVSEESERALVSETRVQFRALSRVECEQYWQTGEPCDKAGGYAIQGLGAVFVNHLSGSYSGVVGLPLAESCELLTMFDLPWWRDSGMGL